MAVIEYAILAGFAIVGLMAVLSHHPGTVPLTRGWLSLRGVGGHGSLSAGFLLAVFMYGGWGAVSPARLQAHGISALVYTAQAIGGSGWAKLMALALALSVIGSTGTGIVF